MTAANATSRAMNTRTFCLGDVLSITTRRLVSPRYVDGVYDILNYMTGDDLSTIGLLSAYPPCAAALLHQHPQLADVDASVVSPENWQSWMAEQVARFGDAFDVTPLDGWRNRSVVDDIEDLARIRSDDRGAT